MESGVTKGFVKDVGCVTLLSTYYAFNDFINNEPIYSEFIVLGGRVDSGEDVTITIEDQDTLGIAITVTTQI